MPLISLRIPSAFLPIYAGRRTRRCNSALGSVARRRRRGVRCSCARRLYGFAPAGPKHDAPRALRPHPPSHRSAERDIPALDAAAKGQLGGSLPFLCICRTIDAQHSHRSCKSAPGRAAWRTESNQDRTYRRSGMDWFGERGDSRPPSGTGASGGARFQKGARRRDALFPWLHNGRGRRSAGNFARNRGKRPSVCAWVAVSGTPRGRRTP